MHMQSFVKIKPLRNGEITLSSFDIGESCRSQEFLTVVANMPFNAIREDKNFRIYSVLTFIFGLIL